MRFGKIFRCVLVVAVVLSASVCFAGEWGYDGQSDVAYLPADWGHISEACDGASQSPIDIVSGNAVEVDGTKINFEYKGKTVNASNNGHAVTSVPNSRSITILNDNGVEEKFTLLQFHFHTLSEHTVDGQHYDMEMHLVHANDAFIAGDPSGKLAVLGVFIEEGDKNKELEDIFKHLPHASHSGAAEVITAEVTSNYKKLLPDNKSVYSYSGSLTTPGCNEIVSWFVFDEAIEMSAEQIEDYRHLYSDVANGLYNTNRPVQPLNGRVVSHGEVTK